MNDSTALGSTPKTRATEVMLAPWACIMISTFSWNGVNCPCVAAASGRAASRLTMAISRWLRAWGIVRLLSGRPDVGIAHNASRPGAEI